MDIIDSIILEIPLEKGEIKHNQRIVSVSLGISPALVTVKLNILNIYEE